MTVYYKSSILMLSFIITTLLLINESHSQSTYIQKESFVIPWGDSQGELSLEWKEDIQDRGDGEFNPPPGPSSINEMGGYVMSYDTLVKYSLSGIFIAEINLMQYNIMEPSAICVSNSGEVMFSQGKKLHLFDSELELISIVDIPNCYDADVMAIWPSENNNFWCVYDIYNEQYSFRGRYLLECYLNGSLSEPLLLYSGSSIDPERSCYYYISPIGTPYANFTDKYSYYYKKEFVAGCGYVLRKYSDSGEVVFEYPDIIIEGWSVSSEFFPTWNGNFYHQYGTSNGLVITKYELNLPPICNLVQVTDFLNPVIFPFPVEFDTPGTYDPNGDALTYEWDFDGDGIFDEPFDDVYGGSPNNPTHVYTDDFDGVVSVRVRDPYDGECYATSHLTIHD